LCVSSRVHSNINSTDPQLLTTNMAYADAAGLGATNPLLVQVQDKTPFLAPRAASPPRRLGLSPAFLAFSTAARRPV